MTDRAAAFSFSMLLVCLTAYLCFRGIAWVFRHGWRSMLGLVAVRGEAVISFDDVPAVCVAGDCDHDEHGAERPDGRRTDPIDALIEACNEDATKAHFVLWEVELQERAQ